MRIAHVVQRYLPAQLTGSEIYMQCISEGLAKRGHKVTVLTSNAYDLISLRNSAQGHLLPIGISKVNNVKVVRFRVHSYFSTAAGILHKVFHASPFGSKTLDDVLATMALGPIMPGLYFHLLGEDYDLVHATPQPLANVLIAWSAAQRHHLPFVCTPQFHFELPYYYNEAFKTLFRCSDAIIACTNIERRKIIELGVPSSKIFVVPRGIEPKEYEVSSNSFRKRYRLEDALIVLYAGTKAYDKGAIHVLKAMEIVQRRRKDVVLVAIGLNTSEWGEHKRKVSNGINILDLGYVDEREKREAFSACDIFVMPSRADAFGIAYLEAWACGKPVIGAGSGATQEVIRDGVDGFLVQFGDVPELARKILLLLKDGCSREKMGFNGRSKVLSGYTLSKVVEKVEYIYERVSEAPSGYKLK
ncbi:MAG: glycosyltransferase family 4 protein [Candidatus Thermoplasmatota archaeon]|nr:glycosyltransferase family 4 protein [Candidatus Thermoplasmatota archaeon]